MITINFSRVTKTARFPMPAQHADFTGHGEDPYFEICRAMADSGYPDGPGVFVDERGVHCLTVRSVHACGRRYRPNAADKAAKHKRVIGDREYLSWGVA